MLVFGDTEDPVEAVEKGRTQSPPPSGQEEATDQLSTVGYCSKLMCCIVGLQGAYLTWGVLQVGCCGAWLFGQCLACMFSWKSHVTVQWYSLGLRPMCAFLVIYNEPKWVGGWVGRTAV